MSTHYYVLSLSTKANALFEAFRDSLIEVENQGFPVSGPAPEAREPQQRLDLARQVDQCFDHYHALDARNVVLVGTEEMQSAFDAVTVHSPAVIGRIEGNHIATGTRDLGQIVWPVVREAMSGVVGQSMRDLSAFAKRDSLVSGLEAVAQIANPTGATLLVEDDYHVRGSIRGMNQSRVISPAVDIRDAIDDAVDAVIEDVLESGGNVVFMPPGTLWDRERIVLLLRPETPEMS